MFSGDLLFQGSIGRTDLPGGDHPTMLRSLTEKVLPLADDIVVLPGHGDQTTIGRERATNPFLLELLSDADSGAAGPSDPRTVTQHGHQDQPAERVPRAAARRPRRRARGDRLARRAPSSCTASPTSRPASSSRSTDSPRAARSTRRSTSCAGCRPSDADDDAGSTAGLHYDLTVPFARYVLEHAGHLEFPFRRFQIQPAWRGERPQEGRYRQFTQADVDIVGSDELPFHHDVEVMRVMVEALDALPLPAAELPVQQPQADPGLLPWPRPARRDRRDPHHRQARQAARGHRRRAARRPTAGATAEQARRCLELATIRTLRRVVRRPGPRARASRTTCSTRVSPSSPPSSRAAPPAATGRSPSRPTCASPAASTTTPAPSSRSSWRATSG